MRKACIITQIFLCLVLVSESRANVFGSDTTKVFFAGSSYYSWHDMPGIVEILAQKAGKPVYFYRFRGAGYLADFTSTAKFDEELGLEQWDYIILQGTCSRAAFGLFELKDTLYSILNKARDKCRNAKVAFCMPWAYEDGLTFVEGHDETYEDLQKIIYNNILSLKENLAGLIITPVGWTWYHSIQNRPDIKLFDTDYNHPSFKGSYLMSCVVYSTIFQDSLRVDTDFTGVTDEEEEFLQKTASDVVLNDLSLWNILKTTSVKEKPGHPEKFSLGQNYPNPFNHVTQIFYSVPSETHVSAKIYDLLGKEVRTLLDKNIPGGTHLVNWNGENNAGKPVVSGMYLCILQAGKYKSIRKMVKLK